MTGPSVARPWVRLGLAAVIGLALGALTQLGQGLLPDEASQAANAISPWLLVAFLVAATLPDTVWGSAAAIVVLSFSLVGYYALVQLRFGYGGGTGAWVLWGLAAVVGGVVFGSAGWTWRHDHRHAWRAMAIGLVAGVFIGEGLYQTVVLERQVIGIAFVAVGLALPALLGRTRADRLGGYVAIVPALALGAVGFLALTVVAGVTAGIG